MGKEQVAWEQDYVRPYYQGLAAGLLVKATENIPANVEQGTDEDGGYLPYFDIVLPAGSRVRFTVEVVSDASAVGQEKA